MSETTPSTNRMVPPERETSRIAEIAEAATPPPGRSLVVGFVAPGSGNSAEVLAAVAGRVEKRGGKAVRMVGRRLEQSYALGALDGVIDMSGLEGASRGPGHEAGGETERACRDRLLDLLATDDSVLVVDDAQWLDDATLRVLVGVVERAPERGVSIAVAHRPVGADAQMAALDASLARSRALQWLAPLGEAAVGERAALVIGSPVSPAAVEVLYEQSGGMPTLVDKLAEAWGDGGRTPDVMDTGQPPAPTVVQAVRTEIDQLPPTARTVLGALSAGADLDDELLATVTGQARADLVEAFEMLRAAGLLMTGDDEVVPAVAGAVAELTQEADRRRFHAALASALAQRAGPPTRTAEHLAAAGASGKEAAAIYIAAGEACLAHAPELAQEWFDRAAVSGASDGEVTAHQAEAQARLGASADALKAADAALGDHTTVGRERALVVMAALLPARGLWARATSGYGELRRLAESGSSADPEDSRTAAGNTLEPWRTSPGPASMMETIGSLLTGTLAGDATDGGIGPLDAGGSLEIEALALTARGMAQTLEPALERAEAPFLEAAELLENGGSRLLWPDSPHALGATVALAVCELTAAEQLLTRAVKYDIGGQALRLRHRILLGWVAVRAGKWAAAEQALADTRDEALAPREQLLAAAIEAGLARRGGDVARLTDAWQRAEDVLLPYAVDLLSLDVLGELAIAASRLGRWDQISHKARELGDVLRGLGEPPLWVLPLRWSGLQVALASEDPEAVTRRAAEVAAVTPVHPRLQAFADAAAQWVEVMAERVDPHAVAAAANGLQELSLSWEASRLTGQAAIRSGDPSMTRSLLEQARDLKASLPSNEPDQTPAAASVLSEREQTVAQHIVDGLTYKEIGAQLYISPKTVEHHVAKIRQKLGASTRAEMLAALRGQLG